MDSLIVELPGRCVAAAVGGDTVWCAAGGRLLGFTENGTRRFDVPLLDGVNHIGAGRGLLVASLGPGTIAWLDPRSGSVLAKQPAGAAPLLVSGGGAVWAVDRSMSMAWRVREDGALDAARLVPGVDRVAADGDRLWWTMAGGALLRDFERTVDLGVTARDHGALAVCAGSVWISVAGGLIRVGTWAAEKGPIVEAPDGPVPFLTCSDGVLVGASERGRLFVLDPSADADARVLDVDTGGNMGALVALGGTAWVFSAVRAEARLIIVRAG